MKLLADTGVAPSTIQALRGQDFEVLALADEGLHRLSDEEISARAASEGRVIVAFDLDPGDRSIDRKRIQVW